MCVNLLKLINYDLTIFLILEMEESSSESEPEDDPEYQPSGSVSPK